MRILKILSAVFIILSVSACSSTATNFEFDAEGELHQQLIKSMAYYNANDIEQYKAMYTEDAFHISVRRPMIKGREAIGKFFAPGMKLFTVQSDDEVLDAGIYGDTGHLLFKATLRGQSRPGFNIPPFEEKRIIMVLFKKRQGQWLIHRYIASFSPEKDEGVMAK